MIFNFNMLKFHSNFVAKIECLEHFVLFQDLFISISLGMSF